MLRERPMARSGPRRHRCRYNRVIYLAAMVTSTSLQRAQRQHRVDPSDVTYRVESVGREPVCG